MHIYVIVDFTNTKNIREVSSLGVFVDKQSAKDALFKWKKLMEGNGRQYRVKAVTCNK